MVLPFDRLGCEWNRLQTVFAHECTIVDDSLREGRQSPDGKSISIASLGVFLRHLSTAGIKRVILNYPGADDSSSELATALRAIARDVPDLEFACIGRAIPTDIEAIANFADVSGVPASAYLFRAFSTIRLTIDGAPLSRVIDDYLKGLRYAQKLGLRCRVACEDATRTSAIDLQQVFTALATQPVDGILLADSVGVALPTGSSRMISFASTLLRSLDREQVELEFHGHNDRGLALANALAARGAGCHALHGTLFGRGERNGIAPTELLILNDIERHFSEGRLRGVHDLVDFARSQLKHSLPDSYPLWGGDAFSVVAGLHAAAMDNAYEKHPLLFPYAYSWIDPSLIDRTFNISLGAQSGKHACQLALKLAGLTPTPTIVDALLSLCRLFPNGSNLTRGDLRRFVEGTASCSPPNADG